MGGLSHLVQRRGIWAGCGPAQSPPRYTKCNGQCTNFVLFEKNRYGTIIASARYKGLTVSVLVVYGGIAEFLQFIQFFVHIHDTRV